MEFSNSDKVTVLLNQLSHQLEIIEQKRQREQKWFDWLSGMLLASFGVVVAISDRTNPLPYPIAIKALASIMILVPTFISVYRISREKNKAIKNAETAERIQQLLHLYDDDFYGKETPYPKTWKGKFAAGRKERTTPTYYSFILLLMAACVVASIWLLM